MCKNLLASIQCALTHDIRVCDECRKCKGKNAAEIRVNLITELRAALMGEEVPVTADENGLIKIDEGHYRLLVDDEEEDEEDEGSSEINR